MNQSLFALLQQRLITPEDALARSPNVEELRDMIQNRGTAAVPAIKR
jgi:Tfp pilus assembly ATPase PilU